MRLEFYNTETKRRNSIRDIDKIEETPISLRLFTKDKYIELAKYIIQDYTIEFD